MIVAAICGIAAATLATIAVRLGLLIRAARREAKRRRVIVPHQVKRAIGAPFGVAVIGTGLLLRTAALAWMSGSEGFSSDSIIGGIIAHGPPGDLAVSVAVGLGCWALWMRAGELEDIYRP